MLRWIVLLVLVVGLSAAVPVLLSNLPADEPSRPGLAPPAANRDGPPGKAYVEGSLAHEFGTMAQYSKGEKEWTIKNAGQGDLELTKGVSSCQCTVANFEGDTGSIKLAPGESTTIKVTWDTKANVDEFNKTTSILTSDPERPQLVFQIKGVVQPALITMPPVPDFGQFGRIPNSSPQVMPMLVTSVDKPDFQILEATSSNPDAFGVSFREAGPDELKGSNYKRAYRVDVEAKPSGELGAFREEVVVKTDHPQRPELRLVVQGARVGPIMLSEPEIRIFDANAKRGGSKSVIVSVQGQEETHFEVAEKPQEVEVEIRPIPAGADAKVRRYNLTAIVPPGIPPGTISGVVVLRADHPEVSVMKIPVSASVLSESY